MRERFEALGTTWWIEVFDTIDTSTAAVVMQDVTEYAASYEAAYSRFKPDSLLSTLNRERILAAPPAEFVELLHYGQALYKQTDGVFNILTGHILEARGYDAAYSFTPTSDVDSLQPGNPETDLHITPEYITLTRGNLDLGGYGKGYLIDLLAARLQTEHGVQFFLINGGGDMYATSDQGAPIAIVLEHPTEPGMKVGETTLKHQGFAASAPFTRSWPTAVGAQNHLVGTSTSRLAQHYVTASTAAAADATATTSLLMTDAQLGVYLDRTAAGLAVFDPATSELSGNRVFFASPPDADREMK